MRNLILILLFSLGLNAQDSTIVLTEVKAFPTAEGFGKNTTGGRGGAVYFVTNLNNSGTGSLRDAWERTGARTIIPRVSGRITLTSDLTLSEGDSDVTFAGELAPLGGMTISGQQMEIFDSNVIVRYISARSGEGATGDDCFRILSTQSGMNNIILDHVSGSWGMDGIVDIGANVYGSGNSINSVTVQNSILSENLDTGYGMLIWRAATDISIIRNLFAHNTDRNPRSSTQFSRYELVNNVVYNFGTGHQPTDENWVDMVGNVYLEGENALSFETLRLEACSGTNCPDGATRSLTRIYQSDNTLNGGSITISSSASGELEGSSVINSGYTRIANSLVQDAVLSDVGNNLYLDSYDTQVISDVINGTGSDHSTVAAAGGYPTIPSNSPYTDADSDGMEDAWETLNGLNPESATDRNNRPASMVFDYGSYNITVDQSAITDYATEGYTALEFYMHYKAGDHDRLEKTADAAEPTCSDGIQNGDETGVDCGGSCDACAAPTTSKKAKIKGKAYLNGSPVQIYISE